MDPESRFMKKMVHTFFIIVLLHAGFTGIALAQDEILEDEAVQPDDIQQNVNDMLKLLEDMQTGDGMNEGLLFPKEGMEPAEEADPLETLREPRKTRLKKNTVESRIEKANEVVRLDPDDPQSHFQLGLEYWASKNLDEAILQFQEVVRLDQENAHAYWNLGLLYDENNRGPEATANIKKAEEIYTKYNYSTFVEQARKRLERYSEKYGNSPNIVPVSK